MKKTIVLGAMLFAASGAWAQKSKLRDTKDYLADQNYRKAMVTVNEAANHEDTKNNPETWYLRGMVYLQQAIDSTANAPDATKESLSSLMKALSLKPDYGPEINNGLYSNALLAFNEGVAAYKTNPSDAYDKFMKVVEIYNVNGGKRFAADQNFTKLAVDAKSNAAYAAVNAKRYDDALKVLNELKTAPGPKDSNIYLTLLEIYRAQNNDAQLIATINEGRAQFPKSQTFRNHELNYYIGKGQSDVLLGKLEEAVKGDPNNPELLFNLANVYESAAFPKDGSGSPLAKPANFNELFSKAESTYQSAVNASPNSADYYYNFGVLYYESAIDYTRQMNAVTDMSAAGQKKYDALVAQRNAVFSKALPHFEKAYSLLDARAGSLDKSDKTTYENTLKGLREIYNSRNDKAKADEMKAKLDALRK